jgi:TPR repeat protein
MALSLRTAVRAVALTSLIGTRSAVLSDAATPPAPRRPLTEIEWEITEIARDIAEMAVYAKTGAAPGPGFAVGIADAPAADVLPIRIAPTDTVAAIVAPVRCPDLAAAPEPYVALARLLLQALALSPKGTEKSATPAFLEHMADFHAEVLARENVRISAWLEREPLNPEAHDEAAFLAAALALKEQSGEFSDPREALLRAAAHLAMAGALRPDNTSSATGFFARELLRVIAGDREGARKAVRARATSTSAGEKAWSNVIEIQATQSWKVLDKPLTATLVERVLHFRALAHRIRDTAALTFLQKRNTEATADWGRTALSRWPSVAVGNVFADQALLLEITELAAVAELERAAQVSKESPPGLAAVLKSDPARSVEIVQGKARLKVLTWSLWSRFFQRHLMHAAVATHRHLAGTLALPEEARKFRADAQVMFTDLELAPLVRDAWMFGQNYEERIQDNPKPAWDRDAAGMFASREFVQAHPQLVTPEKWKHIGDPPGWVKLPGEHTHDTWFAIAKGPFDAMRSVFTLDFLERFDLPAVERVAARMPYETAVLSELYERRHGDKGTLAQFDTIYAALLDLSLNVMEGRAKMLKADFAQYRQQMTRVAAVEPCRWQIVAAASLARGTEEETADALRKLNEECVDRVAVSQVAEWLVDYDLEKGRAEDAAKLARQVAEVGSGAGMKTLGHYLEAKGDLDGAENQYRSIVDRYQRKVPLAAFYARQHRIDAQRYAAQAAEWEKKIFPGGLEPVALADFFGHPAEGVRFDPIYWPAGWNLDERAIVGAVDGHRVRNANQYQYLNGLTHERRLTLIVWDGTTWREVSGSFRIRAFGATPETYSSPVRPEESAFNQLHQGCHAKTVSASSREACLRLAYAYRNGDGTPRDEKQAAELYRRVCDQGDGRGCVALSRMAPLVERGTPEAAAFDALQVKGCALEGGGANCFSLGQKFQFGQGVPADQKRAEQYYRRGCEMKDWDSCASIAEMYHFGNGALPKDDAKAAEMWQKSCELGNPGGCSSAAELHEFGRGVPVDLAKALSLYDQACRKNQFGMCQELGERYESGRGVAKDEAKAAGYYRRCCDINMAPGCRRLAAMHESGRGVPQDLAMAATLVSKANDIDRDGCTRGDPQACEALKAAGISNKP